MNKTVQTPSKKRQQKKNGQGQDDLTTKQRDYLARKACQPCVYIALKGGEPGSAPSMNMANFWTRSLTVMQAFSSGLEEFWAGCLATDSSFDGEPCLLLGRKLQCAWLPHSIGKVHLLSVFPSQQGAGDNDQFPWAGRRLEEHRPLSGVVAPGKSRWLVVDWGSRRWLGRGVDDDDNWEIWWISSWVAVVRRQGKKEMLHI